MTEPQQPGNTPGEQPPGQPSALDPLLEPAALAQLAQERPDLWSAIQAHPNCYPELRDWISQQAPAQGSASVEQFTEGAKKAAAGAKAFFDEKVAPAAKRAAQQAQSGGPNSPVAVWASRAPLILPAAAFLGMITLFLPMMSHRNRGGFNFFSDPAGGIGVLYLVLFLLIIAASGAALYLKAKWATITSGVLGGITGLFAAIDGFFNIIMYAGENRHSPGIGLFFLFLLGVVMLAASVLIFLSLRRQQRPASPPPPAPSQ